MNIDLGRRIKTLRLSHAMTQEYLTAQATLLLAMLYNKRANEYISNWQNLCREKR